jgi:putative ATPase
MERRVFYAPKGEGHEAKVKERLERWAALRAKAHAGDGDPSP